MKRTLKAAVEYRPWKAPVAKVYQIGDDEVICALPYRFLERIVVRLRAGAPKLLGKEKELRTVRIPFPLGNYVNVIMYAKSKPKGRAVRTGGRRPRK